MRGVAGIALVLGACAFDSGGQASSTSIGETSSASTDPTSSTDPSTAGPTTSGETTSDPSSDGDDSDDDDDDSDDDDSDDGDDSDDDDGDESTTTELEGGSTSEPVAELCNGVDDDDDGAVDEYSERNTSCGSCAYEVTGSGVVQSYCDEPVTWPEALQRCMDLGASLAILHSSTENDEVFATTAGDDTWIGLSDADLERDWVWHDGTAVDFDAWEPGQPNDLGGEDCGHMRAEAGTWNDDECTNTHSYVCRGPQ